MINESELLPKKYIGTVVVKPPLKYSQEKINAISSNKPMSRQQQLEIRERDVSNLDLVGLPIDLEHMSLDLKSKSMYNDKYVVGVITGSWYDGTARWINYRLKNTQLGRKCADLMDMSKGNPVLSNLSLTTLENFSQGANSPKIKPHSVALCIKGARDHTYTVEASKQFHTNDRNNTLNHDFYEAFLRGDYNNLVMSASANSVASNVSMPTGAGINENPPPQTVPQDIINMQTNTNNNNNMNPNLNNNNMNPNLNNNNNNNSPNNNNNTDDKRLEQQQQQAASNLSNGLDVKEQEEIMSNYIKLTEELEKKNAEIESLKTDNEAFAALLKQAAQVSNMGIDAKEFKSFRDERKGKMSDDDILNSFIQTKSQQQQQQQAQRSVPVADSNFLNTYNRYRSIKNASTSMSAARGFSMPSSSFNIQQQQQQQQQQFMQPPPQQARMNYTPPAPQQQAWSNAPDLVQSKASWYPTPSNNPVTNNYKKYGFIEEEVQGETLLFSPVMASYQNAVSDYQNRGSNRERKRHNSEDSTSDLSYEPKR
jgi:hypothetical protein